MDDPPIVPNGMGSSSPRNSTEREAEENPYAPSASLEVAESTTVSHLPLSPGYWITVVLVLVLFVVIAFLSSGMSLPFIVAMVFAAIRVPLLRRKLKQREPTRTLPNEYGSLGISFLFVLFSGFASFVSFAVVCVPGTLIFAATGLDEMSFLIGIALGSLAALFVFGILFFLSLKFPM